ncbi:MAG: hypothetical protein R3Y26_06395 [Rikenellaceae bacterium]
MNNTLEDMTISTENELYNLLEIITTTFSEFKYDDINVYGTMKENPYSEEMKFDNIAKLKLNLKKFPYLQFYYCFDLVISGRALSNDEGDNISFNLFRKESFANSLEINYDSKNSYNLLEFVEVVEKSMKKYIFLLQKRI